MQRDTLSYSFSVKFDFILNWVFIVSAPKAPGPGLHSLYIEQMSGRKVNEPRWTQKERPRSDTKYNQDESITHTHCGAAGVGDANGECLKLQNLINFAEIFHRPPPRTW